MSLDDAHREAEWMVQKARERAGSAGMPTSRDITSTISTTWSRTSGIESAKEQYRNNTDCAYAAIRPICQRIARSPIRLGKMVDDELIDEDVAEGLTRHKPQNKAHKRGEYVEPWRKKVDPWVKQQVQERCPNTKDATAALELVHSHPFLKSLQQPSRYITRYHLIFATIASLQSTGRAYWLMTDSKDDRRKKGFMYDIWPIPSHWLEPDNSESFHSRWKMRIDGTNEEYFVPNERIAYFYYPDGGDPFGSLAPMHAANKSVLADQSIKTAWKAGFDNGMTPDLMVTIGDVAGPDGKKLTKPQLEAWQAYQIESRLNQLYRGPEKHRRVILMDRIIDKVEKLSNKPDEMAFQESSDTISDSIYQTFGVNKVITGENDNTNRAAALVADSTFCDNVVNPTIEMLTEVINNSVLPLFDPTESLVAWIESIEKQDPEQQRQLADLLARNSAITRNELRALFDLPPLPDGDSVIIPLANMLMPVETDRHAEAHGAAVGGKNTQTLIQLLQMVGEGKVAPDAAVALVVATIPEITEEQARDIFEGTFGIAPPEPKPGAPEEPAKSVKKKTHPDG